MRQLPQLLASALLACGTMQLHADEVKLTTALPVGETLHLALNADLSVTLTWAGGDTQTIESDGSLLSIPVKQADLTITSTQGKITSLYVQGNRLTALDVQGAPALKYLLAADNQLTELIVASCPQLVTVDVQDNQLTSFVGTKLTELQDLNVANNQLSGTNLRIASTVRPITYVASGNALTSVPTATAFSKAQTVWIQGNAVKQLALTQSTNLRSVCASSNQLTSLTFAAAPLLHDVWAENNQLTTLDLSKGSPKLVCLAADHNKLTTITWDAESKRTCKYAYLDHNALFLNSMPSTKFGGIPVKVNYEPQDDYALPANYYDLNTSVDFSALMAKNGWSITVVPTYTLVDGNDYTLVKGTDFTESSKKFVFKEAHKQVVMTVSTADYTFRTQPFGVGTTESIGQTTAQAPLRLTAQRGQLQAEVSQPTHLTVYSLAGVKLLDRTLAPGTHVFALPAGIVVAGGQKLLIP